MVLPAYNSTTVPHRPKFTTEDKSYIAILTQTCIGELDDPKCPKSLSAPISLGRRLGDAAITRIWVFVEVWHRVRK